MTATNSANCKCSIQFDYDGIAGGIGGEGDGGDRDRGDGLEEEQQDVYVSGCTVHLIECLALAFEWLSSAKPTLNANCECEL